MIKTSHSKTSSYEYCPRQYYFQYVQKVRVPMSHPLAFGIAYHNAVEVFLNQWVATGKAERDDAKAYFEFSYLVELGMYRDKVWLSKAHTMLDNLFNSLLAFDDFQPLKIEQFRKDMLPGGDIQFVGKLDCLALVNGERVLIDWKTAADLDRYPPEKVATDGQLTGYGWLCQGEWDKLAFVVGSKATGQVVWLETTRTQEQLDTWCDETVRKVKEMQKSTFQGVYDNRCKACDYARYGYCQGLGDF